MSVRFYDENGSERDLPWAEDLYGTQAVHDPGVRIIDLLERDLP